MLGTADGEKISSERESSGITRGKEEKEKGISPLLEDAGAAAGKVQLSKQASKQESRELLFFRLQLL